MLSKIITVIINLLFSWLKSENVDKIESENESLKGRAESIEDSFEEQEKAKKDAEEAKEEINKQGSEDDIFGSKEYNS